MRAWLAAWTALLLLAIWTSGVVSKVAGSMALALAVVVTAQRVLEVRRGRC